MATIERRNAVVLVSDDTLIPPAKYLRKVLRQLNRRNDTDIILVVPSATKETLSKTEPCNSIVIGFDDLPSPGVHLIASGRLPPATYHRLSVPRMLQENYKSILYLDIDVVVKDESLFSLFDCNLYGAPFAACQDVINFAPDSERSIVMEFNGEVIEKYFNSGVLLIDVDVFLDREIDRNCYGLYRRVGAEALPLADQTALNVEASGEWVELSPRFNMWPGFLGTVVSEIHEPCVVHFLGPHKPWAVCALAQHGFVERWSVIWGLIVERQWFFLIRNTGFASVAKYAAKKLLSIVNPALYPGIQWHGKLRRSPLESLRLERYLMSQKFVDVS